MPVSRRMSLRKSKSKRSKSVRSKRSKSVRSKRRKIGRFKGGAMSTILTEKQKEEFNTYKKNGNENLKMTAIIKKMQEKMNGKNNVKVAHKNFDGFTTEEKLAMTGQLNKFRFKHF